ncbi:sulfite exporter TauE/SafE family protein [Marivita sp. S0852]|uniref:sulfite exporter TauE/SafE family protein n=1 Tax=Marivita sp. S0852 TaxID=3373893 RepID=UPI003981A7F0
MSLIELFALSAVVFGLAGTIKGLVGIGLPTAAISLLTLTVEPRVAIALTLAPMVVSNAWQVWQAGDIGPALRRYWVFAAVLAVSIFATVSMAAEVSDRVIFLALGVSIVAFSIVNLRFDAPALPDRFDRAGQVVFGGISGLLGGLSGVWGPPQVIYLAARRVPKDEFVRATGMLIFIGSLPLSAGYVMEGLLTAELAMMSVFLIVPTLLGFAMGARVRARLSNARFRRVLLYVFLLLGLNLLRKGVF